jgi:hypothetical protein
MKMTDKEKRKRAKKGAQRGEAILNGLSDEDRRDPDKVNDAMRRAAAELYPICPFCGDAACPAAEPGCLNCAKKPKKQLKCGIPGCDCGVGPMYFHGLCHIAAPMEASHHQGCVLLACAICKKPVARFAVAGEVQFL